MHSSSSNEIFLPPNLPKLSTWSNLPFFQSVLDAHEDTTSSNDNRTYIERFWEDAHETLMRDYFVDEPKFVEHHFRHRFCMSRSLFLKIVGDIDDRFEYFLEGFDRKGKKSFTNLQKCTSAIWKLATSDPPDNFDDYLWMDERTSLECLDYFCDAIIALYSREFLRRPTSHDVACLFERHEETHKVPGMLGSIDCTHFVWRAYPRELKCQYKKGDHQYLTIILEVTSQDLWIWYSFFGPPGSNNDINFLNQSPSYPTERNGKAPNTSFTVNGRFYKRGYFFTNEIYLGIQRLLKHIRFQRIQKKRNSINYKSQQERMSNEPNILLELLDEDIHHGLRFDLAKHVVGQDLLYLDDEATQATPIEDLI